MFGTSFKMDWRYIQVLDELVPQDFIHIVTGVESARLTVLGVKEMSRPQGVDEVH